MLLLSLAARCTQQHGGGQIVQGPFMELVRSLRVLHLQPQQQQQRSFSSDESSSSGEQEAAGGDLAADFHRKVAALQEGPQGSSVNAWLKQGPGSSASSPSAWRSSSELRRAAASATGATPADAGYSNQQQQSSEGSHGSSSSGGGGGGQMVHPDYGYAVLGGIDPASSQQVAGAQQPKLHPTRNYLVGEMYDPLDLSPLAREEEEPWVPQRRRVARDPTPGADVVREQLDYKNVDLLLKFVSASGRIKPRRQTRLPPRLQSRVARAVKLARRMALMPYEMRVGDRGTEVDTWLRNREYRAGMQE